MFSVSSLFFLTVQSILLSLLAVWCRLSTVCPTSSSVMISRANKFGCQGSTVGVTQQQLCADDGQGLQFRFTLFLQGRSNFANAHMRGYKTTTTSSRTHITSFHGYCYHILECWPEWLSTYSKDRLLIQLHHRFLAVSNTLRPDACSRRRNSDGKCKMRNVNNKNIYLSPFIFFILPFFSFHFG